MLAEHNPRWSVAFAELSTVLVRALEGLFLRVEHVGSTAVPGLRAKPTLDVDIVIPGYDVFPRVVAALAQRGYTHNGDQGIPEREAFKRGGDTTVPWTEPRQAWMDHHLYVCPVHGRELHRHLRFRDALRQNPELRTEYECLKLDYAQRAQGDRKVYAQIKELECRPFVERVLAGCLGTPLS
jgi:GrpB-like predicted nucleotidyltransferase (UPF0157 family)